MPGPGAAGYDDGVGIAARFWKPKGLGFDTSGNLYIADTRNNTIRKAAPDGTVTTFAGQPSKSYFQLSGSADGVGPAARFEGVTSAAADSNGNVFVTDGYTIRKITPDAAVSTFAGNAAEGGSTDGVGTAARFGFLDGISIDKSDNLYVADLSNQTVRKITPAAVVTTIAGSPGQAGYVNGSASDARFRFHYQYNLNLLGGTAVDLGGNVYVADAGNNAVRKIAPDGTVSTLAGAPNRWTYYNGGGDGPASVAALDAPSAIATDTAGNVYVNGIRKVTPLGFVTTLTDPSADYRDPVSSSANFNVGGIAIRSDGKIFASDSLNNLIRVGSPPPASQPLNISTRGQVTSGEGALIGGFIVNGSVAKKVIVRAIGPSLGKAGVTNALADPVLDVRDNKGNLVATNDDWRAGQQAELVASGIAPSDDRESALIATLSPGSYTAVVRGQNGGTGIALVEVYDYDTSAPTLLANVSTRGFVATDNGVLIGGFILGNSGGSAQVLVRAIGPSLASLGVSNPLADPTLELRDHNGALITANDNWKETQQKEIEATGIAPTNPSESAIIGSLPAGNYTAVVRGLGGSSGVGLVEIYNLR